MIEYEMYTILREEKPMNLGVYWFYKISEILWSIYIILRDIKGNVFYVNNYIN